MGTAGRSIVGSKANWYFNDLGKLEVIKTIASLPGVYTLEFLDASVFTANAAALAGDPDYPLPAYPSVDATHPTVQADPFNPPTTGPERRYPLDIGFDLAELAHAKAILQQTVQSMPAAVEGRFFCVRGVRPVADTAGAIAWATIPLTYDPTASGSPIADGPQVPGDDTQPAWTARLVTQPASQIVTVKADLDHAFMMGDPSVLAAIGRIMGIPEPALFTVEERRRLITRRLPAPVGRSEALDIVRGLQAVQTADRRLDRGTVDTYVEQFPLTKLRAVARRVIQDILKRPNVGEPRFQRDTP